MKINNYRDRYIDLLARYINKQEIYIFNNKF